MSNLTRSVGVGELGCPMVSQFDAELVSVKVSNKSAMENARDYYKKTWTDDNGRIFPV